MKLLIVKVTLLFFTTLVFTGCYEDYLLITSNYSAAVISADSSTVFFFHSLKAEQPPKGISRFPDGGSYKKVYKNVQVFSYDLESGRLNSIHEFGDVPFYQTLEHIAIQNNHIVFSLSPLMGWNWIKKHNPDSIYKRLFNEYTGFFKYSITDKSLNRFVYNGFYPQLSPDNKQIVYLKRDSVQLSVWHLNIHKDINQKLKSLNVDAPFKPIIWNDSTSIYYKTENDIKLLDIHNHSTQTVNTKIDFYPAKFPLSKIKQITTPITYARWGFYLREHYSKSNKEYINDIVKLNGNFNYRKAIIETISADLSQKEVQDIINRMQKHQAKLQGIEKTEYEITSQETMDELKKLMN